MCGLSPLSPLSGDGPSVWPPSMRAVCEVMLMLSSVGLSVWPHIPFEDRLCGILLHAL